MTEDEAVKELNLMFRNGDTEADHARADDILLLFVPDQVREAYEIARHRCGFWYA